MVPGSTGNFPEWPVSMGKSNVKTASTFQGHGASAPDCGSNFDVLCDFRTINNVFRRVVLNFCFSDEKSHAHTSETFFFSTGFKIVLRLSASGDWLL